MQFQQKLLNKTTSWRISIASFTGLFMGLISYYIVIDYYSLEWPVAVNIMCTYIVLGFAIGISKLKIHYLIHGAVLGFIITMPSSIICFMETFLNEKSELTKTSMFLISCVSGIISGMLIDLITTKVFRYKAHFKKGEEWSLADLL